MSIPEINHSFSSGILARICLDMINTAIEIAAPTSHARVTGEVQYHARHRASPISII